MFPSPLTEHKESQARLVTAEIPMMMLFCLPLSSFLSLFVVVVVWFDSYMYGCVCVSVLGLYMGLWPKYNKPSEV